MSWARVHRWFAIVLAVLLAVWSITGLLFHLKPGWDRAYDLPSAERRAPLPAELVPIANVRGTETSKIELFDTAIGPLYRITSKSGTELVDATTGRKRSPLSETDARTLVVDAVSRSPHVAAYGEIASVTMTDDIARVSYASDITVEIGRSYARISQRGDDTDRIDWLYRVHYLQWTGNATVDKILSIAGLALIWVVVIAGLVLFKQRWK